MTDIDLKVHYSSLADAATTLRAAATHLGNELDTLRSRVEAVSQSWDGEAQQSFKQADAVWRKRTEHIQEVLGHIAHQVEQAHASYHATDKKASSYFHVGG